MENQVILNTIHYAVSVKENPDGVIVDIFHRDGELIETHTYWNDDVIDKKESITYKDLSILMGGSGKFSMGGIESLQVNAPVLKGLVDEYPEMFDMESAQNDSPTVKEFLDGATEADDIFLVYVVSDNRDDKRVSIEGILTMSKAVSDHFKQWKPDEYNKSQGQHRLWWD